jgi:hypothetical protein
MAGEVEKVERILTLLPDSPETYTAGKTGESFRSEMFAIA